MAGPALKLGMGFSGKKEPGYVRNLAAAIILFSSNLAWFYIFHFYLLTTVLQSGESSSLSNPDPNAAVILSIGKLLFYVLAVISGIVGSLISERVNRKYFLACWLFLGLVSSVSLAFFSGFLFSLILSALLGISFGLGFPACQALLTESTGINSRGKVAGISIFITLAAVIAILLLTTGMPETEIIAMSIALKIIAILALLIAPLGRETGPINSWFGILKSKDFFSYAIPWFIFNLANGLLSFGKLSEDIQQIATIGVPLELAVTVFAAIAAGFLADRYGRKQPMIVGLVALGIGYAFFGIVSNPLSYLLYLIVEGLAWGLIVVSYMQVILGDISVRWGSKERYFALGGITIPFLTRTICDVTHQWTGFSVTASSLSSLLSIVTFLSVIPVLRAPETLPESNIHARKLKSHIEKVEELIAKSNEENIKGN